MTRMLIDRSTVEQALLKALKISLRLIRTHVEPEAVGAERFDMTDSKELAPVFAALKAALAQEPQTTHSDECWRWHHKCAVAKIEREQAREIAAQALNARERELLQGLIERELWHATTCDAILARPDGNHRMASAQKGWDMERVALLRKLGGLGA